MDDPNFFLPRLDDTGKCVTHTVRVLHQMFGHVISIHVTSDTNYK